MKTIIISVLGLSCLISTNRRWIESPTKGHLNGLPINKDVNSILMYRYLKTNCLLRTYVLWNFRLIND